jgi:hypothetical protein
MGIPKIDSPDMKVHHHQTEWMRQIIHSPQRFLKLQHGVNGERIFK